MSAFSEQVRAAVYREHATIKLAINLANHMPDGNLFAAARLADALDGAWEGYITSLAAVAERRRLRQRAPLLTPCALCGRTTCMDPYTDAEMSQISLLQL